MYRLAIRHLDREVLPRILQAIAKGRGWENTLFVLTADHGESWCERYPSSRPVRDVFDFHGRALYEENLRIPLIMAGAIDRGEIAGPVTHMDLARTLAVRTGAEIPAGAFADGVNFLDGGAGRAPLFAVADRDFVDAREVPSAPADAYLLFSCLAEGQKLIRNFATGQTEWYDLDRDPMEKNNLAATGQSPPSALLRSLETEWRKAAPIEWDADEEKEIVKRLKELGYY
jgi:arylsulfatase A-like enzyme